MAGGPHASIIPCDLCQRLGVREPAERTYEGSENDAYRCARGHAFSIHWRQVPDRPLFDAETPSAERERIAVGAYYRYLARRDAATAGDERSDWLAAEREARGG
jgi:hypothetical protein